MKALLLVCCLLFILPGRSLLAADKDLYGLQTAETYLAPDSRSGTSVADHASKLAYELARHQENQLNQFVLALSAIALVCLLYMLHLYSREGNPAARVALLRAIVVVFVAYLAVALAIQTPGESTLSGVISLLSAIVGYVFGRASQDPAGNGGKQPAPDSSPAPKA